MVMMMFAMMVMVLMVMIVVMVMERVRMEQPAPQILFSGIALSHSVFCCAECFSRLLLYCHWLYDVN